MSNYTRFTNLEATGDFKSNTLNITTGIDTPSDIRLIKLGTVKFSATSGAAVACGTIPKGYTMLKAVCNVTTAFNSGTSDVLILGTATTADAYFAAADITETTIGVYYKDLFVTAAADIAVKAKLTKEGTTATAGEADFYALIAKIV